MSHVKVVEPFTRCRSRSRNGDFLNWRLSELPAPNVSSINTNSNHNIRKAALYATTSGSKASPAYAFQLRAGRCSRDCVVALVPVKTSQALGRLTFRTESLLEQHPCPKRSYKLISTFIEMSNILMGHIHSMSLDQNSMSVRPLLDGIFKCILQVLLVCGVVNDRDAKTVVVPKVSLLLLAVTFGNTLDLLKLLDLEDVGAGSFAKQRDEHSVFAVRVDAAARAAQRKGGHEQRCTCRRFEHLGFPACQTSCPLCTSRCCLPVVCANILWSRSP